MVLWILALMLERENINIIELEHTNHDINKKSTSKCEILHMTDDLTYNEFFEKLMLRNVPCIIKCASFYDWKSRKEWVVDNKPNFEHLKATFGNILVPVSDCGEKYYNAHKKSDTTLEDYLIYWEKYMKKNCCGMPCLYLKDWHFARDFPEEFIYRVPQYFSSDWLNEYFTARTDIKDDYRFVYMGPKGSWTPLHADVFASFSWSINVCGQKRWLLFPPGEERCLRDNFGHLTYDATSDELKDEKQYPQYRELHSCIEVIQGIGEAIFVPSGWHHQVWNLEDTISINHNWINGCNIGHMWNSLQRELVAVRKEVEDCREMEGWEKQCQLMLKAIFGIDYQEFYTFLLFIAKRRLESLETGKNITLFGNWQLGKNHILFDLKQLREILSSFTKETYIPELDIYKDLEYSPEELIKEIDTFVISS